MKLAITSLVYIFWFGFASAQEAAQNVERSSDFKKPLFFAVTDRELVIKAPRVEYDLQKSKGQQLEINGLVFDNDSFTASLENNNLHFKWDTKFVTGGDISIISEQGKELWKKTAQSSGTWVYKNLSSNPPQWKDGERFHFCIRSEAGRGYSGMCTQTYAVDLSSGNAKMGPVKSSTTPRVIFQNDEKKLKGNEEVAVNAPVQFLGTITTGATYEFVSEPVAPVIRDMVASAKKNHVTVTGELPEPLNVSSKIVSEVEYSRFTMIFGFESTIGTPPDLWEADLPMKNSSITLPGKSGGTFIYDLEIQNPPTPKDRRFVRENVISSTYSDKDQVEVADGEGNVKIWEFEVPKKFEMNTVYLEVPTENDSHRSSLEIYRGGSREISTRLTGIMTTEGDFVILGEGHFSWWFNEIFGSQSYYLSKQRWGVSARYFTSLTKIPASQESSEEAEQVDLNVAQVDLRYRLNPGIWEKDETIGLIMAYETMSLGTANVPKLGVGVFWARSMPRAIDNWFNVLPFMNYPKWVDMEFIKYVQSMDSKMTLGDDYVLNFHGKVLWTPQFFGEAGFGIKNYYFENTVDGSGAKLTTLYGTVGLGVNF